MNEMIIPQFQAKTMSSREIAELCQKTHANVLRDIRVMLINLYGDDYVAKHIPEQYRNRHSEYIRENADSILAKITGDTNWNDKQNQSFKGFKWQRDNRGYIIEIWLDKEHSFTLVSGYNAKLRMAIIKRWQELEQQPFNPATLSRMQILQLAMQAEQENQALKEKIAVIEPQAHALQRITQQGEDLGLRESAKVLKVGQSQLIQFLLERKWIYRDGKDKPQAYQEKINQGYLVHHYSSPQQTIHGERVFSQVKITAKGIARLSVLLNQNQKVA